MRIPLQQVGKLRFLQAHLLQGLDDLRLPLLLGKPGLMNQQALAHYFFNCQARRERGKRVLKHHLHGFAQQ